MFLRPSITMAVEAWSALGSLGLWFLQRTPTEGAGQAEGAGSAEAAAAGGIRAVTPMVAFVKTDEQRRKGNRALSEFVQQIKREAASRTARTGGRIGVDADLPRLVTDAGRLRDFYLAAGADYDGDDRTTVMPPPAPGQDTTSTTAGSTDEDTTSTTAKDTTSTTAKDTTSTTAKDTTSTTAPTSTTAEATTSTTAAPTSTATTVQVERPGTPQKVAVSYSGVVTWDPPGSGGPVTSYIVYVSGHGNIPTGPDNRSADISHWIEASKGSTVRVYVIARNLSGWSRDSGIVTLNL